jgi:hypothetical protein
MLPNSEKKYSFKVKDIRNTTPNVSVSVYANSVSKAVELFLQDYLKNGRLSVEITEDTLLTRRI